MRYFNIVALALALLPASSSAADDVAKTPPADQIIIFPADWPSNLPMPPVEVYSVMEEIAAAALGSGDGRRDEVIGVPNLRMLGKKKPKTVTFKMELTPDNFPEEIYWAIVDLCTFDTIFEKFDYTKPLKKVKTEVKLPAGKSYLLYVNDAFGDGFCFGGTGDLFDPNAVCIGGFKASYDGKVILTDGSVPYFETGAVMGRGADGSYVGC